MRQLNILNISRNVVPVNVEGMTSPRRRTSESHWILATVTDASDTGLSGAFHGTRNPRRTLRGDDGINILDCPINNYPVVMRRGDKILQI